MAPDAKLIRPVFPGEQGDCWTWPRWTFLQLGWERDRVSCASLRVDGPLLDIDAVNLQPLGGGGVLASGAGLYRRGGQSV